MPTLPSCECLQGKPLNEIAAAIYCAFYTALSTPMNLPDCECVQGQPLGDILWHTYCALRQYTEQPFSGSIVLAQISDLDASWIPPLQAPLSNFSITANQISDGTDAGKGLLTTLATPPGDAVLLIDGNNIAYAIQGSSGNVTPPTTVIADRGVVTLLT